MYVHTCVAYKGRGGGEGRRRRRGGGRGGGSLPCLTMPTSRDWSHSDPHHGAGPDSSGRGRLSPSDLQDGGGSDHHHGNTHTPGGGGGRRAVRREREREGGREGEGGREKEKEGSLT